jgi:hypothetical protein
MALSDLIKADEVLGHITITNRISRESRVALDDTVAPAVKY